MSSQGADAGGAATSGLSLNRTVRPSRKTGWTSGLPGSRPSVNSRNSELKFGGPAHSTPPVRFRRSNSPLKAASVENDPRLTPNTSSFGRAFAGRSLHRSYTASTSARPASRARVWSTMNDTHDGR